MWSQLQRKLYEIIDPQLNLQVHCAAHRGNGKTCINPIPRFWVTLEEEVIFDCLHEVMFLHRCSVVGRSYRPCNIDSADICGAVIRYVNAPVSELMNLRDRWGLFDILVSADRRVGRRRWAKLYRDRSEAARKVLIARGFKPAAEKNDFTEEINTVLNILSASNKALKSM